MKIQTKTGAVIAAGSLKQNDPVDYRTVGSGNTPLATFGLMVDRKKNPDGSSSVEWLNCKAWRSMAAKAAACPGGADVLVAGHMDDETWTGRDGQIHSRQVCVCEFIAMEHSRRWPPRSRSLRSRWTCSFRNLTTTTANCRFKPWRGTISACITPIWTRYKPSVTQRGGGCSRRCLNTA